MIVADIDFFKNVNDTYGHVIGDQVIKNFSGILKDSIRVRDYVGRVGGEEFCILLATANDNMASMVAETARSLFEQCRHIKNNEESVLTASFGVAEIKPGDAYEDIFKRADQALYVSKKTGRNKVTVYSADVANNEVLLSA